MKKPEFFVNDKCIGCRACVFAAENNFKIDEKTQKAFVFKQPENEEELKESLKAKDICPVGAIEAEEKEEKDLILASSKVRETLEKYPELKEALVKISPKFKRLYNPVMWNTVAKYATFRDAARVTGVSICVILHTLNKALGLEDKLKDKFPECLKDLQDSEEHNRFIDELFEEAEEKAKQLENEKVVDWKDIKDTFEKLDGREMKTDPFDVIMKKAYEIEEGSGFILIQRFYPQPLINMLSGMGFEHEVEEKSKGEYWVYFYKKVEDVEDSKDREELVIQSATPIAYPIIMRLLQSERIRKMIKFKGLKVWEETEAHLGWIINKKADISFSAVLVTPRLKDLDIKMPAVFVWDNFYLITRGYEAKGFEDIIGREIYTPLFEEAPPTKITKYLIKSLGLSIDDFKFVYGNPFGRPQEIMKDLIFRKIDTAILREPEASFVIKVFENRGEKYSVISFADIWRKIDTKMESFPNAGVLFKGELVREKPELVKLFLEELKEAVEWVKKNKKEAAKLSFDIMRQPIPNIELFLDRVGFRYEEGDKLVDFLKNYFDNLVKADAIDKNFIDDKFFEIFKL